MLNISVKTIGQNIDTSKYKVFKELEGKSVSRVLIRVMVVLLVGSILAMFLPWTQNICQVRISPSICYQGRQSHPAAAGSHKR